MRAGFIGLGTMGAAMAANLAKAGLLAAVWNRTPAKADRLAAQWPCLVARDPADLARQCDVIFLCVSADADVLAVIDALAPGLQADAVVVDCSTVSAATARQAAAQVNAAGAHFLDGPVSGGAEGARDGTLVMMIGGEQAILARIEPALQAMARRIVHLGPVGSGQAAKAVNQLMAAGINQAVSEGLAFAQALGLPLAQVLEIVGAGAADSWFLRRRGPTMIRGEYPPGFKLELHDKDLAICQAMALEFDVHLPLVEMTRHHYRRLMQAGHGAQDISALHRLKLTMFDATVNQDSAIPE